MSKEKVVCVDCGHCTQRSTHPRKPGMPRKRFRCVCPTNGFDGVKGYWQVVECRDKNPNGECTDFERRPPDPLYQRVLLNAFVIAVYAVPAAVVLWLLWSTRPSVM